MSGLISGLVWNMDLPQTEKYVLLAYADHADHEGYNIRPSYGLIAWKTGYTRQGVIQIVKRLAERGIMVLDSKGGVDATTKKNRANEWHIDVSKAPMTAPRIRQGGSQQPLTTGSQQPLTTRSQQPLTPSVSIDPSIDPSSLSASPKARKAAISDVLDNALGKVLFNLDKGSPWCGRLRNRVIEAWRERFKTPAWKPNAQDYLEMSYSIRGFPGWWVKKNDGKKLNYPTGNLDKFQHEFEQYLQTVYAMPKTDGETADPLDELVDHPDFGSVVKITRRELLRRQEREKLYNKGA